MFEDCSSLSSLPDISKWKIDKKIEMKDLFKNCYSLSSLPDISQWNNGEKKDVGEIFKNCQSLSSLPNISEYKWENDSMFHKKYLMFQNCFSLVYLNLSEEFYSGRNALIYNKTISKGLQYFFIRIGRFQDDIYKKKKQNDPTFNEEKNWIFRKYFLSFDSQNNPFDVGIPF